jgi:hypothetical protein
MLKEKTTAAAAAAREKAEAAAAAAREKAEAAAAAAREKAEAAAAAAREKAEAAAAAAREKAEAAGSYLTPLKEKAQGVLTDGLSNVSAGTAVIDVGVAIATIIPKIFNAVFSLMVMVYILSTIARNPRAFAEAGNEHLKAKLADLKDRMQGLPGLKDCINIFESKIQKEVTMNPPSPPPPESNVGKTCIYSPGIATTKGTLSYQALIVGEWDQVEAAKNGYGQPMYFIWVNGGGLDREPVFRNTIKIVPETAEEFTELVGNRIGQQNVTMQQAREYYSLTSESLEPTDGLAPPIIPQEQKETLVDMLKRRRNEFLEATDKKQFIADAVNGYIAASKLRLGRFTERVQDEQLKRCIQSIKEALTLQIKTQVDELKRTLLEIGDSTEFPKVFDTITALGQGLRDQFGALNERVKESQVKISNFLTDNTNKLSSSFGSFDNPFGSR